MALIQISQSLNKLSFTNSLKFSEISPRAYMSVPNGPTGIASINKDIMKLLMHVPQFEYVRAGFQAGTLTIEFRTN